MGTTIFSALEASDTDLVGDILEVRCLTPPDLCDFFEIVPRARDTDIDMFRGAIALRKPFNYRDRQIYPIQLGVFDGRFNDTAELIFTVIDVQNMPPIFEGSLTGIVNEDDPVGSVVMRVAAKVSLTTLKYLQYCCTELFLLGRNVPVPRHYLILYRIVCVGMDLYPYYTVPTPVHDCFC